MSKILIPKEYNYISSFITLRCNFKCIYCINNKDNLIRSRPELSGDFWISCLNSLTLSNDLPITISGGEATLHRDFYKIVNGINHPIDLLTNLEFNIYEFIKNVNPKSMYKSDNSSYKSIRVSYHPQFHKIEDLVFKAGMLQEYGFNVGIFPINYPDNIEQNMELAEEARKSRVYVFIKDYLGMYNGHLTGHFRYRDAVDGNTHGKVMCRTKELLIAPSGKVFKCHRDLYANEYDVDDIAYKFRDCDNYGSCNYCDVKIKTNRFLNMGNSSVDIEKCKKESWDI